MKYSCDGPTMASQRLLIVEDELALRLTLADRLRTEGYALDAVEDAAAARHYFERNNYQLVVLDLMLPGESGLDFCRHLRRVGFAGAILMLTAKAEIGNRVEGLKTGADDYLIKPFAMAELQARIEALLRRKKRSAAQPAVYQLGHNQVDLGRRLVTQRGQAVDLGEREFKLLRYLLINHHRAISRDELLTEVWGYDSAPTSRTVDVHMAWLRSKLEIEPAKPKWLLTVRGLGYRAAMTEMDSNDEVN